MTVKEERLEDLVLDESNANAGTERGRFLLDHSLRKLGAGRSILLDKEGRIIAGNKTVAVAGDIGLEDVIVVETDGSKLVAVKRMDLDLEKDPAARELAYADNRTSEVGLDWEAQQLHDDLEAGVDLDIYFWEEEVAEILAQMEAETQADPGGGEDPGAQLDRAAELQSKWNVERGDVWEVGPHRLMCGDGTNLADVVKLMDGQLAAMVFTDPPYNVAYQANESLESLRARNRRTDGLTVTGDTMTEPEFGAFLDALLAAWPLQDGGAYYLCAPSGHTETEFRKAIQRAPKLGIRQCIVWVKDRFVFGRQDYHWRHESLLYGWREGAAHYFVDDRTQDTVWEIDRPGTSDLHPTMKPIGLMSKAISNSTKKGEIVFDGCSGSGSTLVACELTGRAGRGLEIDPNYVSVALERLEGMGLTPHRIEGGTHEQVG